MEGTPGAGPHSVIVQACGQLVISQPQGVAGSFTGMQRPVKPPTLPSWHIQVPIAGRGPQAAGSEQEFIVAVHCPFTQACPGRQSESAWQPGVVETHWPFWQLVPMGQGRFGSHCAGVVHWFMMQTWPMGQVAPLLQPELTTQSPAKQTWPFRQSLSA